jgi:hypothetical protein
MTKDIIANKGKNLLFKSYHSHIRNNINGDYSTAPKTVITISQLKDCRILDILPCTKITKTYKH